MPTLYELTSEYLSLLYLLDEDGSDDDSIQQALAGIEGSIKEKSEGLAKVWHELNAKTEARKKESERLRARAVISDRAAKRLRKYLLDAMTAVQINSVEWETGSISVCKNGGSQPIEITGDLPEEYTKTEMNTAPDMDKIREALNNGTQINGVIVKERSHHVRIK